MGQRICATLTSESDLGLEGDMSSKRDDRKQRSEAERLERERQKRASGRRSRVFLAIGVVAVAAIVALGVTRRRQAGRVWSPEHGHWHNK